MAKKWGLEETQLKLDFMNWKILGEIDKEFKKIS